MKRSESEREWRTALYIKSNQSLINRQGEKFQPVYDHTRPRPGYPVAGNEKVCTDNSCTSVGVRDTAGSVNIINLWQFR